jgi:LPXTG-motif cell wall-anchored protein
VNRYRRVLAVAAGAVIGAIGALALASPASAHHSEVVGTPVCDTETGEWVVTWTINSFAPASAPQFKLIEVQVTPADSSVDGVAVTEGDAFPHATGASLVGEQRLPGDAESASLAVRAQWSNGFEEADLRTGYVSFDGPCDQPTEPGPVEASDASTCEELTVTVTNPEDGVAVTVEVSASTEDEGAAEEFDLAPGGSQTVRFPAAEGLTYEVVVDGTVVKTGGWEDPGNCEEIEIPVSSLPDCDSLTIEITNPLEDEAIEATVTSGDLVNTLTIAPGETGEVTIDAEEGTVATVEIVGGEAPLEIPWEQPEGCDGGGGGLPVTGAPTGVVIGAALALLAVGGGLFLVARRRRITFTA